MRVLFVEDDASTVAAAMKLLRRDHECCLTDFQQSKELIAKFDPDVIVLDLLQGPAQERDTPGNEVFHGIWKQQFCPIIVYSAEPDLLESDVDHPFVRRVKKGRGGLKKLAAGIENVRPYAEGLRSTISYVRRELSRVLRDIAPDIFDQFDDAQERQSVLTRSGRRRLAALMDGISDGEHRLLKPWEHYLCPPLSQDLQLGDVLQAKDGSASDPLSFRVVLTPSCDLGASKGREPKVAQVLTAGCHHIVKALKAVGIEDLSSGAKQDKLKTQLLSQGYRNGILPLPGLHGRIPHMAVDLRDLDLILFGEIGSTGTRFERIASVDSPFRELIAWAYMQVGCRPGVPDRDLDAWCDGISTCLAGED